MCRNRNQLCWAIIAAVVAGCGTTRWSDTSRTATEQMLLSTAIDRAISDIDFSPLAGKDVFLDEQYLKGTVDSNYIIATLRQQLLASGCLLKADRKEATYIVEARAGGVGTNRHDVMLGVPAFNVPSALPTANTSFAQMPSSVPEIPFAKMTDQKGLAKIAVFAYNQKTGLAVWQSGAFPIVTNAKDSWLFGMGPVQRGSIYGGTKFAGSGLVFSDEREDETMIRPRVPVAAEAVFEEPATDDAKAAATNPTDGTPGTSANPPATPLPAKEGAQLASHAAPAISKSNNLFPNGSPHALIGRLPSTEKQSAEEFASDSEGTMQTRSPDHTAENKSTFRLFSPSTWFGR